MDTVAILFNNNKAIILKVESYEKKVGTAYDYGGETNAIEQIWEIKTIDDQIIVVNNRNVMFFSGENIEEIAKVTANVLFETVYLLDNGQAYTYK